MSRKKKSTQDKVKTADVAAATEAVMEAAAPKKAPREAVRVQVDSREKAQEVLKPVAIALLEAYPTLPETSVILEAFAAHYRSADERRAAKAEAEARAAAEAALKAAEEKAKPASRKVVRPPPMMPPTAPSPRVQVPSAPVAPRVSRAPTPPPEPLIAAPEAELPPLRPAAEPASPTFDLQPDTSSPFANNDDLFGTDQAPAADDIFAALGKASAPKDDDFTFAGASEYSDPFISVGRAPVVSEPDEATTALPAFDDVQAVIAEEAAPNDRTSMIQAMPDDEPDNGDGAESAPEEAQKASGRRSRKSSTRKKR